MGNSNITSQISEDLGSLKLSPYFLPAMSAGKYSIQINHEVKIGGTEESFKTIQEFTVSGSGYEIERDIVNCFPENNAVGKFTNLLPQIVLNNKSLPWEKDNLFKKQTNGVFPWLGLLLFRDGEDFTISSKTSEDKSNTFCPVFKKTDNEIVTILTIEKELFKKIAPKSKELQLLSHVREEIPSKSQSASYLQTLKEISTKSESPKYAVVACNRLPGKGTSNTVCLVSFEHWGEILDDIKPNELESDAIEYVGLRVLKHWRFQDNTDDIRFSNYLRQMGESSDDLALKLPTIEGEASKAKDKINKTLQLGFVPMQHHLRNGDQTVSFYRGPLIPYDNSEDLKIRHNEILGADSSTRYNPTTAMFNESYAAAYQLGKLLALSSQKTAQAIMNFREESANKIILVQSKKELKEQLLGDEQNPLVGATAGEDLLLDLAPDSEGIESLDQLVLSNLLETIKLFVNNPSENHE